MFISQAFANGLFPRDIDANACPSRGLPSRSAGVATRPKCSPPSPAGLTRRPQTHGKSLVACHAKKKGLFDEMLDVMEGGPKLRKWYGQDSSVGAPDEERSVQPSDASRDDEDARKAPVPTRTEVETAWDSQPRRATLVTDADTALGEAIIMQLIVAKQPVVAMGLTPEAASMRFGPYVTAADVADLESETEMAYVIRKGVRAIISCGAPGAILNAAIRDGKVKHVICVGSAGDGGGFLGSLFGGEENRRREHDREDTFTNAARAGKIPLTIVRPATIKPGIGGKPVVFSQKRAEDEHSRGDSGEMNLEDAAECVVRCLGAPPKNGVLRFDARTAPEEQKRAWKQLFAELDCE